ncbi:YjcZ family sporulation protein [Geomicrobium sp. JCM 19055]|nr:YjcZ family sporulation protein [Geomicrobium sp. JCM 19055]
MLSQRWICGSNGLGGFAFVVVLFILLVIVGSAYC